MNVKELCIKLQLEPDVIDAVNAYRSIAVTAKQNNLCDGLYAPADWDEAVQKLRAYCRPDERGLKILSVMLDCLCDTYRSYIQKGIDENIFWDTMKFIPRFMQEDKRLRGVTAFTWDWWLPRQISLHEFRIGQYEYEFTERDGKKIIFLHIPSDADLSKGKIDAVQSFASKFFPEYLFSEIRCDSWLLSPALAQLLPPDSNIIRFQKQFRVTEWDKNSPAFMDWVYSSRALPYADLPENTLLQKNMKRHLLSGGCVGWACGIFVTPKQENV